MRDDDMITRHHADKLLAAEGLGFNIAFEWECWDKYSYPNGTIYIGFVLDCIADEIYNRIDGEV